MRRRPQSALLVLATALAIALAVGVSLNTSSRKSRPPAGVRSGASVGPSLAGAALPPDLVAPDFTLADQRGRPVRLSQYRGSVTILAFLSSTCGSTCELIAQQVRGALDELPRPVPVLFVSADPGADTRANVSRFLARVSLSGRVSYLTGPEARLRPIWRAFHVVAASRRGAFERTASVLLVDARGHERVLFGLEALTPESLAHDIRTLQAG
jgi:protein SCO1/2